jgi:hypothetical protein
MSGKGPGQGSGYEVRDTQVPTLFWLLAVLLGSTLVVVLLMKALYNHFETMEERRQGVPSTLAGTRSNVPPEPRLQSAPFDDLKRMRAEEDEALTTYGWVDKQAGIVRIPIERALDIAAQSTGAAGHTTAPSDAAARKQ